MEVVGDDVMENRCVCCGAVIPEGMMVCPKCLVAREHIQTNYERILSMSLVDLAVFICDNTRECCDCKGFEYCVANKGHANGLVTWMKKEVQDGEE